MNVASLYREELLDHYQNPRNFGRIDDADAHSRQTNPLCGDDISLWVIFDKSGKVKQANFEGKGCAICLSGASMLTEYAVGKPKSKLTKFSELDMLNLLGIDVSETRKKCALLSLAVLKDCLR